MKNKLAIIILNKSNNRLLFDCLTSIKEKTKFPSYHIYIGDTGSTIEELNQITLWLKENFGLTKNVTLLSISPYNFAKNNNLIVNKYLKDEDIIVFCNNDIKLVDDCLTSAVELLKTRDDVGTIGYKLLFDDHTIQHAAQLLYIKNGQFHQVTHRGLRQNKTLFNKQESVLGNTGALLVTSAKLFKTIGGFSENYLDCFEDVEYNLRCLLLGKQNIYIPKVAMHYESVTRNKTPNKMHLLQQDARVLIPFINKHIKELTATNLSTIINVQ